MDSLFENPIIIKLQEFGQKLGANNFMASLQGSMMGSMSLIMCGSVFQIICAVGGLFGMENGGTLYNILYAPYNFTMGLVGLWITGALAFNYAKSVGVKSPMMSMVEAMSMFILVACYNPAETSTFATLNTTYLGSQGMFIGFLVAFVVVQVDMFCQKNNIRIPMPDVCPPSLVNGMAAIIPSVFNAAIFLCAAQVCLGVTGMSICAGFMAILSKPLAVLLSVPGMFVLALVATLMWCFGIHGTMLIVSVLMAPMIEAGVANAAHYAAGEPLVFYPVALFGAMAYCGGTGNTLPLCLMGLKSKSKQIAAVSKIGAVPGWFGINEPVTFGMPIMYNPILCIPYILNVQLVTLCTLIAYKVGFLHPAHVLVMTLMPMGFADFLGTFRWQNAIWSYLTIIPAGLVWFPFFKAYEKTMIAQEAAAEAEEA